MARTEPPVELPDYYSDEPDEEPPIDDEPIPGDEDEEVPPPLPPKEPLPRSPRLPPAPPADEDRLTQVVRLLGALNLKIERIAQALEKAGNRPEVPWMATPPGQMPPFRTEPAPPTNIVTAQAPAGTISVPSAPPAWICPVHGTPPRLVPAGTNRTTNKPYPAFWACSTYGCREKVR